MDLNIPEELNFENILSLLPSPTASGSDDFENYAVFDTYDLTDLGSPLENSIPTIPTSPQHATIEPANILHRHVEPASPEQSSSSNDSSRKRKKNAAADLSDVAPTLLLTDDDLLQLNSDTFDEHVAKVQRVRALTDAEKNVVKAQRRKIKNREVKPYLFFFLDSYAKARHSHQSAAKSRKERAQTFESVLHELNAIKAQNAQLAAENLQLRQRLEATTQQQQPAQSMCFAFAFFASFPS